MKRKIISLISIIAIVISVFTTQVIAADSISVKVDGKAVSFPDAKPFINADSRTMVPVRFIAETLKSTVSWGNSTRTVTIQKGTTTISLKIDEDKAVVNGAEMTFDTKTILKDSRTFVPLRFIAEAFGVEVSWIESANTVEISTTSPISIIKDTIPGTVVINGLLMYSGSIKITKLEDQEDFFIDKGDGDGDYEYYLVLKNYNEETLLAIKEVFKIFYPVEFEKAYSDLLETINNPVHKEGLTYLGISNKYYDDRYYGSIKFDNGASVYVGVKGVKY